MQFKKICKLHCVCRQIIMAAVSCHSFLEWSIGICARFKDVCAEILKQMQTKCSWPSAWKPSWSTACADSHVLPCYCFNTKSPRLLRASTPPRHADVSLSLAKWWLHRKQLPLAFASDFSWITSARWLGQKNATWRPEEMNPAIKAKEFKGDACTIWWQLASSLTSPQGFSPRGCFCIAKKSQVAKNKCSMRAECSNIVVLCLLQRLKDVLVNQQDAVISPKRHWLD